MALADYYKGYLVSKAGGVFLPLQGVSTFITTGSILNMACNRGIVKHDLLRTAPHLVHTPGFRSPTQYRPPLTSMVTPVT